MNNINISAIDVYFRSLRSLQTPPCCAVDRLISWCVSVAWKPALTGMLSALKCRRGRISADIGGGRWTPPCCAVGRIIKRRVRVTGVTESRRRVAVSHGSAKPTFCRYRQGKTNASILRRRLFHQPTCTLRR